MSERPLIERPTLPFSRRTLLSGAGATLVLAGSPLAALAQVRGRLAIESDDGYGPYDDDRLYRDEAGRLYRRRGGRYEPYRERATAPRFEDDPDSDPYADPNARRRAEQPPANQGNAVSRPVDNGPIDYAPGLCGDHRRAFPGSCLQLAQGEPELPAPGDRLYGRGASGHHRGRSARAPPSPWFSPTGGRAATAWASASRASPGPASRR